MCVHVCVSTKYKTRAGDIAHSIECLVIFKKP